MKTKLSREDFEKKIIELLADQLGYPKEEVDETWAVVYDMDADSLDLVELILAVDDELEFEIPDPVEVGLNDKSTVRETLDILWEIYSSPNEEVVRLVAKIMSEDQKLLAEASEGLHMLLDGLGPDGYVSLIGEPKTRRLREIMGRIDEHLGNEKPASTTG